MYFIINNSKFTVNHIIKDIKQLRIEPSLIALYIVKSEKTRLNYSLAFYRKDNNLVYKFCGDKEFFYISGNVNDLKIG